MKIEKMCINNIPALLFGNESDKLFLYIHGRYSSKDKAENFAKILTKNDYQVLSFDLPEHGDRIDENYPCNIQNGIHDLQIVLNSIKDKYNIISLYACSLGAYFSLMAFPDFKFMKCLFLSPVLDMEKVINKMMIWENVTDQQLMEEKEIKTSFGETLNWDYYTYVKEHPVNKWISETSILYGENDNLTDKETLNYFAKRFNCKVKIMKGGEHYFHTEEQIEFLNNWLAEHEYDVII